MKKYTVLVDVDQHFHSNYATFSDPPCDDFEWFSIGWPRETWQNGNGEIDREVGPARIVYHENDPSIIIKQEWFRNGFRHRDDGPALIWNAIDGTTVFEKYYIDGELHREDGPAILDRSEITGVITKEAWYLNGELHREGKPAEIGRQYDNGVIDTEIWAINGRHHRLDGPAYIERDWNTGEIIYQERCVHGVVQEKKRVPPSPSI